MASVEVRGLTKVYPSGEVAVDEVDLAVDDGELFVIVGPSGSGKSTLLRMIAGLEQPTAGDVIVDGRRVNDVRTQRRDIAMTFQGGALYPNMTAAENIGFSLKAAGVDHHTIDRRVHEVAELLHVADVLDRRPRLLSGGERQRVAMGRAIIRDPTLFLMDEPLSHLDTRLRIEMRSAIVGLQRRLGVTTVFVTHDQAEAMAMADRVGVMRRGRIVQCATPMGIYRQPADLFVATFLGSPPMTVVGAVAVDVEGVRGLLIGGQWLAWTGLDHAAPAIGPGDPVGVGFRSEALTIDPAAAPSSALIASCTHVEDLGHERLVHATLRADVLRADDRDPRGDVGRGAIVELGARATLYVTLPSGAAADPWRPLRLRVDTSQLYLFDPCSGRSLTPGQIGRV